MLSLVQIGWADLDFFYFSQKLPHHSKLYETTEGGKCRPRFGDEIVKEILAINFFVDPPSLAFECGIAYSNRASRSLLLLKYTDVGTSVYLQPRLKLPL